jgi:hypothetical protein
MIRWSHALRIVMVASTPLTAWSTGTATVIAESTCSYELSAPHLTEVAGGHTAVAATMQATDCQQAWQPTTVTVCVRTDGGAGRCEQGYGWQLTHVVDGSVDPSSGTYVATGTGCAAKGTHSQVVCTPLGPTRSSL